MRDEEMTGKKHQRELATAIESLIERFEGRLRWTVGLSLYVWFNFEFNDIWMALVAKHSWLHDWSYSDTLGGVVQFGSLGIALLIGKVIAKILIIDLEKRL